MKVEVSHHIDASEPDEQGLHDYYYEYDIFTFSEGDVSFVVRAYSDEPDQAAFMTRQAADPRYLLTEQDLQHPLLLKAQDYLRSRGKTILSWLDGERSEYRIIVAKKAY